MNTVKPSIRKILKDWKTESGATRPTHVSLRNGRLTIYSSEVGFFIGKMGILVEKYKNIIIKKFPNITDVVFEEVDFFWF